MLERIKRAVGPHVERLAQLDHKGAGVLGIDILKREIVEQPLGVQTGRRLHAGRQELAYPPGEVEGIHVGAHQG